MTTAYTKPFNQKIRIAALRLVFAALLLVVALGGSRWNAMPGVSGLMETLGIFGIMVAVLGRFWAILYIGGRKNAAVTQDGPYSICRHPLYLFSAIGTLGFGLMMGSLFSALLLAAVTFLILSLTAEREEAYRGRVSCKRKRLPSQPVFHHDLCYIDFAYRLPINGTKTGAASPVPS